MSRLAIDQHMKRERPQPRLLLSKQEAAISLGMSVRHFERHVQPDLRCVRSGQLTLYHLRDLEQWAEDEATVNGRAARRVARSHVRTRHAHALAGRIRSPSARVRSGAAATGAYP